jgi:hypothetical protein
MVKFHLKIKNLLLMVKKSVFSMSKYLKSINFNVELYFIFREEPSKIPWNQLGMFFYLDIDKSIID